MVPSKIIPGMWQKFLAYCLHIPIR
jgi:hypothetical protein